MRVTNSMQVTTLLRNLENSMGRMSALQEQMSSGKRINRPSDDPIGLISSLRLRTDLTELEQFTSNAEAAKSWLETTDSALNESGNILQRIRELAVQAANDSVPDVSKEAIQKEVRQLKEQLIQVANSSHGGRYVFSGHQTQTQAYDNTGVYQGDTGSIEYEVGIGVKIPVNIDGTEAFGNIFTILDNLEADIVAPGGSSTISNTRLAELDSAIDNQLKVRSELGARINRIDMSLSRMSSQQVNMTDLLSKTEDADMAKVIIDLQMEENVYNAALSAGARIIQPTLIDFLS